MKIKSSWLRISREIKGQEQDPDQQIRDLQDKDEVCVDPERPRKAQPNLQGKDKDLKDQEMQCPDLQSQDLKDKEEVLKGQEKKNQKYKTKTKVWQSKKCNARTCKTKSRTKMQDLQKPRPSRRGPARQIKAKTETWLTKTIEDLERDLEHTGLGNNFPIHEKVRS